MKNLLFIILVFIFSASSLSAQQLGFKGGLNFTNVSSEKYLDFKTSNGFHAGVAFEISVLFPFTIGTGFFYTRRGYKSNESGRVGAVSIDYLDIPIDLMVKVKVADLFGVYVSVGPYFSYGISSSVFNIDGVLVNGYNSDGIDLNRIDSGINIWC